MPEAWEDERFEYDEMRKMFAAIGNDPETVALLDKMFQQTRQRVTAQHQRREVFTKLVLVMVQCCEKPMPPEQGLIWMLTVINNSYAVPLPEHDAKVLDLAVAFVLWYQGERPRPAWVPAGFAFTDPGAIPVAPFPLPPAPGDR
jgi:hypothetical protein